MKLRNEKYSITCHSNCRLLSKRHGLQIATRGNLQVIFPLSNQQLNTYNCLTFLALSQDILQLSLFGVILYQNVPCTQKASIMEFHRNESTAEDIKTKILMSLMCTHEYLFKSQQEHNIDIISLTKLVNFCWCQFCIWHRTYNFFF